MGPLEAVLKFVDSCTRRELEEINAQLDSDLWAAHREGQRSFGAHLARQRQVGFRGHDAIGEVVAVVPGDYYARQTVAHSDDGTAEGDMLFGAESDFVDWVRRRRPEFRVDSKGSKEIFAGWRQGMGEGVLWAPSVERNVRETKTYSSGS